MIAYKTLCYRMHFALLGGLVVVACASASDAPFKYHQQTLEVAGDKHTVRVPAGFTLKVLTIELEAPRLIAFASNGDLVIGSSSGAVYKLSPPYTDPVTLVALNDYPHSVAFRPGEMLIAQTHGLYRTPYAPGQARLKKRDVTLLAALPGGSSSWHTSRTVSIGPDGRVYLSLGIAGNCVDQYLSQRYAFENRRGGVLVLNEQGAKAHWEAYASGLRNPVGFDWQPSTKIMYLTNNGPGHWGYRLPPDYFTPAHAGSFHGMPWFQYDGNRIRPDHCISSPSPRPLSEVTLPVLTFPAHSAPMDVAFVTKGAQRASLVGDAIVALHGSTVRWANVATGNDNSATTMRPPKIVVVRFARGKAVGVDNLVTGFQLIDGERWARPVGVAIGPDGALYFTSDEGTEALFRLSPIPHQ